MMRAIDETHDPARTSWVESANAPETDFPIQNLPFGIFLRTGSGELPRAGVAIGDRVMDIAMLRERGMFAGGGLHASEKCLQQSLNGLMALGPDPVTALRKRLSELLTVGSREHRAIGNALEECLIPMTAVEMLMPVEIGDYTDFYASIHHATNVGSMFRPDNPLLPNYKYVPIGYHGRCSSIIISGGFVVRPTGQTKDAASAAPGFGPSKMLDYELEVGCFIGSGNQLSAPIPVGKSEEHFFGICLVNDWSARDIQAWEYQPLGPFLAKNFATTISPWIVTMEALAPFRIPEFRREKSDPQLLPYLRSEENASNGGIDLHLEVYLTSQTMRSSGLAPCRLSRGNFREMYWTFGQMLAHHTGNGCNVRPGDLIASGTVSGPAKDSRGCMMELTWRGTEPLPLPSGETRKFLEDGDEVIMKGYCVRDGFRRIGMGECIGRIANIPIKTREIEINSSQ